ncbi:MAG: hypothetical protein IJX92_04395 [Clostridia bacterium]|nr:hypothetical protein [Clostridia bacterium]
MTKIKYILFGKEAEAALVCGSRDDILKITVDGASCGAVRLEDNVKPLEASEAVFSLKALRDGAHTPLLILGTELIRLPAFTKSPSGISLTEISDKELRAALLRIRQTEKELSLVKERLTRLESYIKTTTIF